MRLLIAALLLSFLPITVMAETKVESFTCEPWSNAGLRMRGDVKLELSLVLILCGLTVRLLRQR